MISAVTFLKSGTRLDIWSGVLILFAISHQVLITIDIGGTSLRVGGSDLLLPVLGLMLLVKWKQKGTPMVAWRIRHFWIWLLVLTLWIGIAILNGRVSVGQWQTWAVVNKGVGWLVLLGYLFAGGCVTALLDIKQRDRFLWATFLFGGAVFAIQLIVHALGFSIFFPALATQFNYPRFTGFFANPNAYGISAAAMAALLAPYLARTAPATAIYTRIGVAFFITAAILSLSRSAWIGVAFAFAAYTLFRVTDLRELFRSALIAMLLVLTAAYGPQLVRLGAELFASTSGQSIVEIASQPNKSVFQAHIEQATINAGKFPSMSERITSMTAAVEAWLGAPVIGIGIGTYFHQKKYVPGFADTIHNSFLWILTETGLIGAGLFLGFFLAVLLALWRDARVVRPRDPFLLGCCGMLLVFAGASIGTEILYQRYFWFLLGLGLALPRRTKAV